MASKLRKRWARLAHMPDGLEDHSHCLIVATVNIVIVVVSIAYAYNKIHELSAVSVHGSMAWREIAGGLVTDCVLH